jgi:hypothetical protein
VVVFSPDRGCGRLGGRTPCRLHGPVASAGGKDVSKIGPLKRLFDADMEKLDKLPDEKYKLFEEVSAITQPTKDDPPVLLGSRSRLDA